MSSSVALVLTSDEALVLFESLSRHSDSDCVAIEDQAEQHAL